MRGRWPSTDRGSGVRPVVRARDDLRVAAAERERIEVADRAGLRAWLDANAATSTGVWLVRNRKGEPSHVPYDDIVDEVLRVGWIDSQVRTLEDGRSVLLLTPRKPGSRWSGVNKARIERLVAQGELTSAGLAVVEAAKASGTWSALDDASALREPPALAAALDAEPAARTAWDGFPPSARRAILEWLTSAKTDATRDRRVAEIVAQARVGRRANQWRQPGETRRPAAGADGAS